MAYIGKQPIVGNYQVLDALTATTTATYALTKNSVAVYPQTPANCIVSLNGVIQAPFDSYTISGSNIVFASALTGSDSIDFITVLGDVLNVGTVSDGTIGLAKLSATGTKDATTFLRGDNTFASAGGANTPSFFAYLSANQNISNTTWTKAQIDTEVFDIGSCYDNSTNYRFTPTAGKYLFTCQIAFATGTDFSNGAVALYKNGSVFITANEDNNYVNGINITVYDVANGTDYYEMFCFHNLGSTVAIESENKQSHFGANKIIE